MVWYGLPPGMVRYGMVWYDPANGYTVRGALVLVRYCTVAF